MVAMVCSCCGRGRTSRRQRWFLCGQCWERIRQLATVQGIPWWHAIDLVFSEKGA